MRKCGSCGYLLLGDGDSCGRCGAPLAPVTVASAPRVGDSSKDSSDSGWPPPPPIPGPAPAAPLAVRPVWEPAAVVVRPAGSARATRLGIAVLAVVVAIGIAIAVPRLRSDPLPAGTADYVSGGGVTYTSPEGAFQVLLPETPITDERVMNVNSVTTDVRMAAVSTDDYSMVVASLSLPGPASADRVQAALDDVMTEGIANDNGKLVRKNLTMRGTLPAVEGTFTVPGGVHAHMLVTVSGTALIMLIVAARTGTDRLYKALEDSLIVR